MILKAYFGARAYSSPHFEQGHKESLLGSQNKLLTLLNTYHCNDTLQTQKYQLRRGIHNIKTGISILLAFCTVNLGLSQGLDLQYNLQSKGTLLWKYVESHGNYIFAATEWSLETKKWVLLLIKLQVSKQVLGKFRGHCLTQMDLQHNWHEGALKSGPLQGDYCIINNPCTWKTCIHIKLEYVTGSMHRPPYSQTNLSYDAVCPASHGLHYFSKTVE